MGNVRNKIKKINKKNIALTSNNIEVYSNVTNRNKNKVFSNLISDYFSNSNDEILQKKSSRVRNCSNVIFVGKSQSEDYKIINNNHCNCRECLTCMQRKRKQHFAKFNEVLKLIDKDNINGEFIFLTLTVKNCSVYELRNSINDINKAFNLFIKYQRINKFLLGYVRAIEVTKEKNSIDFSHPHIHALLFVDKTYFYSRNRISTKEFSNLWKKALKVDYNPIVDVRKIYDKNLNDKNYYDEEEIKKNTLFYSCLEVFKYQTKADDLLYDKLYTVEQSKQLNKVRNVVFGKLFKDYLRMVKDSYIKQEIVDEIEAEKINSENKFEIVASATYQPLKFQYVKDKKTVKFIKNSDRFKK